ncbi:MAG: DUF2798 domain-containing protein [Rhodobacter sp.]|nr:DUF2798 domain-containing protein [Rhodobacter sp.]
MGTLMSVVMSAFITLVNTGPGPGFVGRWATAWFLAWLLAVPLAVLVGPHARRWAETLAARL